MSDLRELYQEIILDHYRRPRNYGLLENAKQKAKGHNPLCGDQIQVFLTIKDGKIEAVSFEGAGCAISTASASLMTEAIIGRTVEEVRMMADHFRNMVMGESEVGEKELGKLEALAGVRDLPVRVKCATLAWHTLQAALENQPDDAVISTE